MARWRPATEELEAGLAATDTGLLVLDPLDDMLNDKIDTNSKAQVSDALRPLQNMIGRLEAFCIGITHPRKGGGPPRTS